MPGGGGKNTPAGQTTVTTSPFNALSMPFVQAGALRAADLFQNNTPQFYPNSTVAPLNNIQTGALNNIAGLANSDPIAGPAQGFDTSLTSGALMGQNPAAGMFGSFAGTNIGLTNPGAYALQSLATGQQQAANPGMGQLRMLQNTNYGGVGANPGSALVSNLAQTNAGGGANPGSPTLSTLASLNNPANPYSTYASGARVGKDNPYTDALVSSIMARVVPSIQQQFIQGGGLSSPEASRTTAAGAMSAIAPSLFAQQQQEEANQLQAGGAIGTAAQQLAGNYLTGAGLQGSLAGTLGNLYLGGSGLQGSEAANLGSLYQGGLNSQIQAASNLGTQAIAGQGLQQDAAKGLSQTYENDMANRLAGLAAAPQTQMLPFTAQQQGLNAGGVFQNQAQQQVNDQIARWNFQQGLPYQQLNTYLGQIGPLLGGSQSTPFFQNPIANALSTAMGVGTVGNGLFGSNGLFGGGAGLFGGAGGAAADFGGGGAALGVADQLGLQAAPLAADAASGGKGLGSLLALGAL
jgi:hypothetical protein